MEGKGKMKILLTTVLIFLNIGNIYGQNRWEKLKGPMGGFITGLTAKGDTVIVGTGDAKALIFYSLNQGITWKQANISSQTRFTDFVFTDDEAVVTATKGSGLYKSFDFENWTNILNNHVQYWSLGKDLNGFLYAGTDYENIFYSSNNGNDWTTTLQKNVYNRIYNFLSLKAEGFFAQANKKLYRKSLTDPSWEDISVDSLNGYTGLTSDEENSIYTFSFPSLFKSSDYGNSWTYNTNRDFWWGNTVYDCIYNQRIIVACGDETGWFGDGWGIAVSDDEGKTWNWSNKGLPPKFSAAYKLAKSGNNTYLGTNAAGVFKSTDFGDSWFPINNGITAANTLDICFDEDGNIYTANWSNGFQRSSDGGKTWEVINNGLTNSYCYSIISGKDGVLIGGTDEGTFRSYDNGDNWERTASFGNNFSYHLFKDKQNRIYSINLDNGLYRTSDNGDTWQRLDGSFAARPLSMAIDSTGNIFVGTRGGMVYRSTDDGGSWENLGAEVTQPLIT